MKKVLLLSAFLVLGTWATAQELGVRWGDVVGNDIAVDAVFSTGEFHRTHASVSFGSGVGVEILWDFLYRPLGDGALNWYAGVGPAVLFDDPFFLGVSGEAGLEYRFKGVPLALGADWRPTFWIIEETDFSSGGFGVNLRWRFGGS